MGFYENHCSYLPAMAGWFFFSALLGGYNKYVFGSGYMSFPCPLLLTSLHFLVQWIVSVALSNFFPNVFGGDQVKEMSWRKFLSVSLPCGFVTSADIGLSNLALVRITLTFYTMVKASAPVFVLISAFLFQIERFRISLVLCVAIITCGEFLTVYGETEFEKVGFILCLSAAILSGIRWTLVQFKIQSLDPPLKTAISVMRVLSPSMCISMMVFSSLIERPWYTLSNHISSNHYFGSPLDTFKTFLLGFIGAFIAVFMIMCEFYLLMKSNAIVLMVGGVLKEMVNIIIGISFFHDTLDATNAVGCFIVFLGVGMYKVLFHLNKMEKKAVERESSTDSFIDSDTDDEYLPVRYDSNMEDNVAEQQREEKYTIDDDDDSTMEMAPSRGVLVGRLLSGIDLDDDTQTTSHTVV